MSDAERAMVLAMLRSAGYGARADWMAASCPSVKRCREVIAQDRREGGVK